MKLKFKTLALLFLTSISLFTKAQTLPTYVPTNGLVGWWPFNGNAKDESGKGNDLSVNGAALSTDRNGLSNSAYYFDGNSSNLKANLSLRTSPGVTISCWGNISGFNNIQTLINLTSANQLAAFGINYSDNAKTVDAYATPNSLGILSIQRNKWNHYLITTDYATSTSKFYCNGILIGSSTSNIDTSIRTELNVGMHHSDAWGYGWYFNGKLDDIGIWNKALSENEIKLLYNPASILVQPKNVVTKVATNAMFIVKTADSGVAYQWQTNTGSGFTNISNGGQYIGASNDTLFVKNIQKSNNNQQFRCITKTGMDQDTSNIASLLIPNVPAYVPSAGLVAWWPFTGNALDSSGYGNHGQVIGATLTTDRNGNPNSAYEFNGSNNYINIANSELKKAINNVSQVTIVTWVNLPDLSLWGGGIFNHWQKGPVSNNVGLQFGYYGNKTMGVSSLNGIGVPTSPVKLNQNEWVMFTCIYDGTQSDPKNRYKVYRGDNILIPLDCSRPGYCDFPNITSPDANETYIGALTDGGSEAWMYFKGKIDDMGVWNRILSPEEITKLLNDCKPSIVQQPSNQTVKETEKAIFTLTSSDPNASYTWQGNNGFGFVNLFNAGPISGVNNDTLTISNSSLLYNNQLFRCIVKSGKCSDTSLSAVLNVNKPNSTSQYKASELIQLYPNPTHGSFYLKVHPVLIGQSFTISDIHGRAVFSGSIENDHTLVTPDLQDPGIYILQTSGGFHYKFRFLTN